MQPNMQRDFNRDFLKFQHVGLVGMTVKDKGGGCHNTFGKVPTHPPRKEAMIPPSSDRPILPEESKSRNRHLDNTDVVPSKSHLDRSNRPVRDTVPRQANWE